MVNRRIFGERPSPCDPPSFQNNNSPGRTGRSSPSLGAVPWPPPFLTASETADSLPPQDSRQSCCSVSLPRGNGVRFDPRPWRVFSIQRTSRPLMMALSLRPRAIAPDGHCGTAPHGRGIPQEGAQQSLWRQANISPHSPQGKSTLGDTTIRSGPKCRQ